jgi:hypothetical protein
MWGEVFPHLPPTTYRLAPDTRNLPFHFLNPES